MYAAGVLNVGDAGLLAGANYAGYLLGAIVASMRPSARRPQCARLAAMVGAVSILGVALVADVRMWVLLRFLAGASGAIMFIAAATEARDNAVVAFGGVGVGIAACALATAITSGLGGTWRAVWIVNGVIAVAPVPLTLRSASPTGQRPRAGNRRDDGSRLRFGLVAAAYGLSGCGYVVTATFLTLIIRRAGLDRSIEILAWLAFGLAMPASLPLWTRLRVHRGDVQGLLVAFVVQALAAGILLVRATPITAFAAASGMGLTVMGIVMMALAQGEHHSTAPTTSAARLTIAYGTGQLAGPLLSAALAGAGGDLRPGLTLSVVSLILGTFFVLALLRAQVAPVGQKRTSELDGNNA